MKAKRPYPNSFYKKFKNFNCIDCKVNTLEINQYYMVHWWIWKQSGGGDRMLCIPCLAKRIGRPLVEADFPKDIPLSRIFLKENPNLELVQEHPSPYI